MESEQIEKYKQAGEIAKQVKSYARTIIKPQMPLLEIAEKIENKIAELGGKPAFPTNLSINEQAAHVTPAYNDDEEAQGLLKVDIGVQIDGYIADTAFSLDLENSEENKNLIEAAETALKKALEKISLKTSISEVGEEIEKAITEKNAEPIRNLSGHLLDEYNLHAGVTIPNYNNSQEIEIEEGAYAIEPFATSGHGAVRDGKPSGIYKLENENQVRDHFAREVLQFIKKEYQTLPFCSRWLVKKFGTRALIALKRIEEASIIHQYPQLIEKNSGKVAQAEDTILITKKEKIITT
ncbi:type II methionyl aminopeptidase [Candidatus Pacearchaeota archaeon]|nr:type II methionyl aminopeptidase [Candidatus Pacearchaeota archaeon]